MWKNTLILSNLKTLQFSKNYKYNDIIVENALETIGLDKGKKLLKQTQQVQLEGGMLTLVCLIISYLFKFNSLILFLPI